MRAPSAPELLDAWERGLPKGSVARGVVLLGLACPGVSEEDLAGVPVGERDRCLLALREATFGPRLAALVACPACGEHLELDLSVRDILALSPATEHALVLSGDDHEVHLRLPDSRDLLACAQADPDEAALVLMRRCVVRAQVDGAIVAADALPPALIAAAGRLLAQADPQADLRFAITCIACQHAWRAPFDAAAFLWTEIESWTGRLLRDVHALACAYGWSERDILALGPARRARYLQMVAG
jgi:hypothetical protein